MATAAFTVFGFDTGPFFALVLLLAIYAGLPALSWIISGRANRTLDGQRDEAADGPALDGAAEPPEVTSFLGRLRTGLRLPLGLEDDITLEVGDHIRDSMAGLEAEGLDSAAAARAALAALGSPVELAGQLRLAHQTRRRLLAGAGGAILAAPGAAVLGSVLSIGFDLVGLLAGYGALALLGFGGHAISGGLNPLMWILMLAIVAFYVGRRTVLTFAGLSRRLPAQIGPLWAVLWTPFIVLAMVFQPLIPSGSSGLVAAVLLPSVPIAFVLGCVRWIEAPVQLRFKKAIAGTVAVGIVVGLVLVPLDGSHVDMPADGSAIGIELAAPAAPAALFPSASAQPGTSFWAGLAGGCQGGYSQQPLDCQYWASPDQVQALAGWSDLRLEFWPAVTDRDGNPWGIAPGSGGPSISISMAPTWTLAPDGTDQETDVQPALSLRRADAWWIVVTGIAPDGRRYRLDDGSQASFEITSNLWQWLTAAG